MTRILSSRVLCMSMQLKKAVGRHQAQPFCMCCENVQSLSCRVTPCFPKRAEVTHASFHKKTGDLQYAEERAWHAKSSQLFGWIQKLIYQKDMFCSTLYEQRFELHHAKTCRGQDCRQIVGTSAYRQGATLLVVGALGQMAQ